MLVNELINEARDPAVKYSVKEVKGKVERITVTLDGNKSGKFTRLSQKYKKIDRLLKSLAEKREGMNAEVKSSLIEYFDAEDAVFTRVVETVSLTAALAKSSGPGSKVDYEEVVNGLLALQPELAEQIELLIAAATKATKGKEGGLTVKVAEGKLSDAVVSLKAYVKDILRKVKVWGRQYDSKLAKLKRVLAK